MPILVFTLRQQAEATPMTLSWTILTPGQQQAMNALRSGRSGVDRELVEQLRNLGLAELGISGVSVSSLGEAIFPARIY